MLLKQEQNTNYLDNWPEHYYEIKDINERHRVLLDILKTQNKTSDDILRLEVLEFRFGKNIAAKRADRFMRGWINAKTLSTERISFFNKKRIEKEFRNCLKDLAVLDYARNDVLRGEWKSFSEEFILSCINSHSYKQIAIGVGHVSDKNVAMRIAGDIDSITKKLPASFSLEEECKELHEIMVKTYREMLENGAQYWNDYCTNLR